MPRLTFLTAAFLWIVPVAARQDSDVAARLAQADADRTRREFDRAMADARAQEAADHVRIAREEADRLAAEGRRQQALAAEYARRRSEIEAQSQATQAEADLVRRNAEQRARVADEEVRRIETLQRRLEAAPEAREPELPIYLPRRRQAPAPNAERRSKDADRPIAMKEGVALCERGSGSEWRCTGPLRVAFGNLEASRTAVAEACGADTIRSLGTTRGFRAFGCGFGLNPRSAAPGNRDVPALFRIEVPGRITFHCPASTNAFCRRR